MKKVIWLVPVLLSLALLVFVGIKISTNPQDALEAAEAKQSLVKAGYAEDNFDVLKKYGIIDDSTDKYIKVTDALHVFLKATGSEVNAYDLSDWYTYDELEPLDDTVDDETKNILMSLSWARNDAVTTEEMTKLDYDANITELEALRCAIRMVGNTYGCTDACEEVNFSGKEDIYNRAYEKGLIDSPDYKNADKPILREDFYEIINRMLYVEFKSGGYAGALQSRYIDSLKIQTESEEAELEPVITRKKLNVGITWGEDLSVSWDVPQDLKDRGFLTDVEALNKDGERVHFFIRGKTTDALRKIDMVNILVDAYPEKISCIRVTYTKSDYYNNTRDEYYFDIDLSHINLEYEGEAPKPGVYTANEGAWTCKNISLEKGMNFEEGKIYVLLSKQHRYRKDEYNNTSQYVFEAKETANTLTNIEGYGNVYLDEIRLMEIAIEKTKDGFQVVATKTSEDVFKTE